MDYTQRLGKKTFLTVRGNLTFNKDKIIENDEPPVDYPWMETRGTNVNATWGFIADGLFTSQAEIEDHATQFGTVHVGDIKYRDLNQHPRPLESRRSDQSGCVLSTHVCRQ